MAAKSDISSSPSTSHSSFKNQFSNDGSFFEQFKKFKTVKDEPKIEPKTEPKPTVPKVENKSVEDDWYKAALARAKEIAQNMSAPPPVSASTTLVKSEPKTEGPSIKLNPDRSGIIRMHFLSIENNLYQSLNRAEKLDTQLLSQVLTFY